MTSRALLAAVFAKEMVETLRDRRTLVVALLLPVILMPVVTVGVPYLADRQRREREITVSRVAVRGAEHARSLVAAIEAGRGIVVSPVADPERALLRREVDALLDIPQDFGPRLREGGAKVTIAFDESEARSVIARQRLMEGVAAYAVGLTEARLLAHGLRQNDLTPIEVASRSVADQVRVGGALLAGLLPFFIAIWAVLGGQHAALDMGAGEKERRTLETLLVAPAPRWILAMGKGLAVATASLAAVLVVMAATLASLRLGTNWGIPELRRASVELSLRSGLWLGALSALLVVFLSALQLALSLLARGVREAQQFFTPLYLVVTLPAMATPFLEGWERSAWTYLAPGLGPIFGLRGVLLGSLTPAHLALACASTAAYGVASLAASVWALGREG